MKKNLKELPDTNIYWAAFLNRMFSLAPAAFLFRPSI